LESASEISIVLSSIVVAPSRSITPWFDATFDARIQGADARFAGFRVMFSWPERTCPILRHRAELRVAPEPIRRRASLVRRLREAASRCRAGRKYMAAQH
jgi:hypothetical protein